MLDWLDIPACLRAASLRWPRPTLLAVFLISIVIPGAIGAAWTDDAPPPPSLLAEGLDAAASAPLFTTYAAAMERSRFVPDQAYSFRYDDSGRAVAFVSRHGGAWGVAFARDGELVTAPTQMAQPPVIDLSYPDMVGYRFSPFDGLDVAATMLVESSSLAVLELVVENSGREPMTVTAAPFVDESVFTVLQASPGGLSFRHEHPADSWTLEHGIPHPVERFNELTMIPAPDSTVMLAGLQAPQREFPEWVIPDSAAVLPVYGQLLRPDGTRLYPGDSELNAIAYLAEFPEELISLDSPVFGPSWDEWRQRGYYVFETKLLPWAYRKRNAQGRFEPVTSNTLRVVAAAPELNLVGRHEESFELPIEPGRQNRNLSLAPPAEGAAPPTNLRADINDDGVTLRWEGDPEAEYGLYWTVWKPRLAPQERRQRLTVENPLAEFRGRAEHVFHLKQTVRGTEVSLDLSTISLTSEGVRRRQPYQHTEDIFARRFLVCPLDSAGRPGPPSKTVTVWPYPTLAEVLQGQSSPDQDAVLLPTAALMKELTLQPGQRDTLRVFRAVSEAEASLAGARWKAQRWESGAMDRYRDANRGLFANLAVPDGLSDERRMLYLSGMNLMRQLMMPPEGRLHHPYYIFSREPTWGWGHGGQVVHESIAMQALVELDPELAKGSMEVYRQVQQRLPEADSLQPGYIPYRSGPYLNETIPVNGELTSAGPFYAWTVLELFEATGDTAWLASMYPSCRRSADFWQARRDEDGDGLLSWGGHAVLESLRDASVVIWDEVAPPDSLEALGLNCMAVMEENSVAEMATLLGHDEAAARYRQRAQRRAELVRTAMWDEPGGFFYHIRKDAAPGATDRFTTGAGSLKRREIIGLLPLWAGIASPDQAGRLMETLTDPDEFWRKNGVPSLSAADPGYNPRGYWNGPVWVQWNYLVFRGLLRYGYVDEARELAERVSDGMIDVLGDTHSLWEFYSPDDAWGGWHRQYIWAGLVNRMWLDLETAHGR